MFKEGMLLNYTYEEEVRLISKQGDFMLVRQYLGDLNLPTGHIVANDPLSNFETEPFILTVSPGNYPVYLSVAHFSDGGKNGDSIVAQAILQFSTKKPVMWEMALSAGEQAEAEFANLEEGDYIGYVVDSGTGGFMDKSVSKRLETTIEQFYSQIQGEFIEAYLPNYSYLMTSVLGGDCEDFVCFTSGFGDGCYPSYFGLDEEGNPCVLVTDFCVVDF
ncbi:MAG: DUF4241 domain-containing protein [Defluviitaleaceae bacterium]|nr:DUF4241 domain-containing protein [Defluviitaleaceae bacterium]